VNTKINIKVNNKSLAINKNVVPDSLIFMLCAYFASDPTTFYFWKHIFEEALNPEEKVHIIK
jgi:hypothetical protein